MYLPLNKRYEIIFSYKNNEMRATYALSPASPKKSPSTAVEIPVAKLPEMKKNTLLN